MKTSDTQQQLDRQARLIRMMLAMLYDAWAALGDHPQAVRIRDFASAEFGYKSDKVWEAGELRRPAS